MNSIDVKLPSDVSAHVESLFYKRNSILSIIKYISESATTNINALSYYLQQFEEAELKLEATKNEVSAKYLPSELKNRTYNYTFIFRDETLQYTYYED